MTKFFAKEKVVDEEVENRLLISVLFLSTSQFIGEELRNNIRINVYNSLMT